MKNTIYLLLVTSFIVLAAHRANADSFLIPGDTFFFEDSTSATFAAPTSPRWSPGWRDGGGVGTCTAEHPAGGYCDDPDIFTEESAWGFIEPPSAVAMLNTNVEDYEYWGLTPMPFNDFLWIRDPNGPPDVFSDYFWLYVWEPREIFLQFNSAFASGGFHCAEAVLEHGDCDNVIFEHEGVTFAGNLLWSDGTYDTITFSSFEPVPEPSAFVLLGAALIGLSCKLRRAS